MGNLEAALQLTLKALECDKIALVDSNAEPDFEKRNDLNARIIYSFYNAIGEMSLGLNPVTCDEIVHLGR